MKSNGETRLLSYLMLSSVLLVCLGCQKNDDQREMFTITIQSAAWKNAGRSRSLEIVVLVENHSHANLVFLLHPFESQLSFRFEDNNGVSFGHNFSAMSTPLIYLEESDFLRLRKFTQREFTVQIPATINKKGKVVFDQYDVELKPDEKWSVSFLSGTTTSGVSVMSKDRKYLTSAPEYFGDAIVVPYELKSAEVVIPPW